MRRKYSYDDEGSIDDYDHDAEIDELLIEAMPGIWTDLALPEGLNMARLYRDSRNTTYR